MELKEDKYYRPLESILKDVNINCMRMDENHTKECVSISIKVVDEILRSLKKTNAVFNEIYVRNEYVGSYYDGLRIKSATEFDLNIIIKLPLDYEKMKIENINAISGYVKVNIGDQSNTKINNEVKKVIERWCEQGYILQNKFREWMEGVCTRTLAQDGARNIIRDDNGNSCTVRLKKSGPAFTLLIERPGEERIDVDLVFTLEFRGIPPPPIRTPANAADPWVLVPKECSSHYAKNALWRISFPTSEKALISGFQKLKFVNRFIKALRDSQNFNIPSYFIKTVFLWEAHNLTPEKRKFWEKNLGYLFVYALNKLYEYYDKGVLPYYWHKKMNLLNQYKSSNIQNIRGCLNNIIKKIDTLLNEGDIIKLETYIFSLYKCDKVNPCIAGSYISNIIEQNVSNRSDPTQSPETGWTCTVS